MEESQASVALQEMHQVWGGLSPPKVEGQHKRGHGAEADEQEPEKWSKPESKGSWGKGQRWNDKWQSESSKNTAKLDEPTLHLLRTLTKMTLRLEEEVGRTGSAEHVRGSDSTLKLLGLRLRPERMQKTALATELENAYLNTSFADWTRRNPQWGRSSKKGSSDQ
eukprot:s2221_g14.t1